MTTARLLRPRLMVVASILLLLTAGCAFVGPPVVVSGTAQDLARLEGSWSGNYTGDADHRRHGTINFTLQADGRQARGSVLMKAEDQPYAYQPFGRDPNVRQRPDPMLETSVLSIRFVYVSTGEVVGELDPYWDPDRRVRAVTTFRGSIDGSFISGTFRTRYANGGASSEGRWTVTRRP
jgi:hypothetical protein